MCEAFFHFNLECDRGSFGMNYCVEIYEIVRFPSKDSGV
jgi:hypothetical protein